MNTSLLYDDTLERKAIGKRLKELRQNTNNRPGRRKETVEEFCEHLRKYTIGSQKISPETIHQYEQGRNRIPTQNLLLFSKYFGVSLDYLTGGTDYETADQEYICKKTGLSPKAVDVLCGHMDFFSKSLHSKPLGRFTIEEFDDTDFINLLIESNEYDPLCNIFIQLCECVLGLKLASKNVQIKPLDRYEEMPLVEERTKDGELQNVCFDTNMQFEQKELYEGLIGKGMWDLNEKIISLINSAIETRVTDDLVNSKVTHAQLGAAAEKNQKLKEQVMKNYETN